MLFWTNANHRGTIELLGRQTYWLLQPLTRHAWSLHHLETFVPLPLCRWPQCNCGIPGWQPSGGSRSLCRFCPNPEQAAASPPPAARAPGLAALDPRLAALDPKLAAHEFAALACERAAFVPGRVARGMTRRKHKPGIIRSVGTHTNHLTTQTQ